MRSMSRDRPLQLALAPILAIACVVGGLHLLEQPVLLVRAGPAGAVVQKRTTSIRAAEAAPRGQHRRGFLLRIGGDRWRLDATMRDSAAAVGPAPPALHNPGADDPRLFLVTMAAAVRNRRPETDPVVRYALSRGLLRRGPQAEGVERCGDSQVLPLPPACR
jgi:hypothetical protein